MRKKVSLLKAGNPKMGKNEITEEIMKTVAIQDDTSCIERRRWREMCLKNSIILSRYTATNQNIES